MPSITEQSAWAEASHVILLISGSDYFPIKAEFMKKKTHSHSDPGSNFFGSAGISLFRCFSSLPPSPPQILCRHCGSFLPSFLPFFLPSFLPSFVFSFLPSLFSFLPYPFLFWSTFQRKVFFDPERDFICQIFCDPENGENRVTRGK